jgi:hypothetical protein
LTRLIRTMQVGLHDAGLLWTTSWVSSNPSHRGKVKCEERLHEYWAGRVGVRRIGKDDPIL